MVLLCVFLQIAVEPLIGGFQLSQVLFLCKGAVIQPVLKVFRMQLIGADVEVFQVCVQLFDGIGGTLRFVVPLPLGVYLFQEFFVGNVFDAGGAVLGKGFIVVCKPCGISLPHVFLICFLL